MRDTATVGDAITLTAFEIHPTTLLGGKKKKFRVEGCQLDSKPAIQSYIMFVGSTRLASSFSV